MRGGGVPLAIIVFYLFVQRLMYEGHRDRPLAHCGGDPFDIAAPDIADREHSGQTGFEEMGSPGERPMRSSQILLRQIGSCLDEPFGIERDAPSSHCVLGIAPVMRKTCRMSWVSVLPD